MSPKAHPDARWFHAGSEAAGSEAAPCTIHWSRHSRRTREAAEREARRMARRDGGRPVVEYWAATWGPRPGNADAVEGAYYADVEVSS